MSTITAFPLQWPTGWKRTAPGHRGSGRFGVSRQGPNQSYKHKQDVTISEAVHRLLYALKLMGITADDVVISSNLPLRLDGLPRSDAKNPQDPGAAVYWVDTAMGGQRRCMAIDQYTKVEQNIAALAATIEAMRAIERHGGAVIMERAFTGFTALPAPIQAGMKRPWREVMGFAPLEPVTQNAIKERHRRLAAEHHPDKGGNPNKMAEINAARDEAMKEAACSTN